MSPWKASKQKILETFEHLPKKKISHSKVCKDVNTGIENTAADDDSNYMQYATNIYNDEVNDNP